MAAAMLLSGCTGFKQMVGLEQQPPDEFAVESRAPLTIPPEFKLRPPEPGAPRPQEVSSATKAQQEVNAATPGKPGDVAPGLNAAVLGGAPDPNAQIDNLSRKLLLSNDINTGATIDKRETTVLKGIY
ncbi:MAG TPA: DUF3035 domain-containing protein [Stellaceae bacterium]|nr:DUF3035 domain-containing protein [Stellaceae bacterium]